MVFAGKEMSKTTGESGKRRNNEAECDEAVPEGAVHGTTTKNATESEE